MKKKAVALITVLVIMLIVGIGTTAILQALISYSQMRVTTTGGVKAQYLAEAGMQYAVWQLRNGNAASPVTIVEDGKNIVITKTLQPDGSYTITSTVQNP